MILSSEINQLSLAGLLARLGYKPLSNPGKELLYWSMLRDTDTKPSFIVDDHLGVWYDLVTGKGGNIIDFGLAFWRELSLPEVTDKIIQLCSIQPAPHKIRQRLAVKIPHYEVGEIKELGYNPVITEYLRSSGIWEAAQNRLKEVYYYTDDQKRPRKHFFAAGWQNELGAWEVRNAHFKGCIGHKAMTWIPGDENRLSVFEGYINYLSWLTENPFEKDSVLVLNSISLLLPAIRKARAFKEVNLFFDQYQNGRKATIDFIKAIPQAKDWSDIYLGFNDYNDKLKCI